MSDDQLKELTALLGKKEELHPDLLPYYEEDTVLGAPSIRHPLVYSVLHAPEMNALVNQQYLAKVDGINRAVEDKRWSTYIWLHERPYRLDAFEAMKTQYTDEEYWHLLGSIWTDSENIWQQETRWRRCLTSNRRCREFMMDEDEQKALADDYDDIIPVYRGFHLPGRQNGLSWTANRTVAKFFARRFATPKDKHLLATGKVAKKEVLAYFDGRSEYEIVALPEKVYDITITEVEK